MGGGHDLKLERHPHRILTESYEERRKTQDMTGTRRERDVVTYYERLG